MSFIEPRWSLATAAAEIDPPLDSRPQTRVGGCLCLFQGLFEAAQPGIGTGDPREGSYWTETPAGASEVELQVLGCQVNGTRR